jgi:hypothetical protein
MAERLGKALLVAASGARAANAACGGFGFARNTATTFGVFYWLKVTNFDVSLFDPAPSRLNYIDVWDFWIHNRSSRKRSRTTSRRG